MTAAGWHLAAGMIGFCIIMVLAALVASLCSPEGRERLREIFGQDRSARTNAGTAIPKMCRPSKPRVRVRSDGWIRHQGGSFPFDGQTIVLVELANGLIMGRSRGEPASRTPDEWWRGLAANPDHDVLFYRIVGHPDPAPKAGRWS